MNWFAWTVTIAALLLFPLVSFFYVFLRLAARASQLKFFFTMPGILKAYLISKGHDVSKQEQEAEDNYLKRLQKAFKDIFENEFDAEYGKLRYSLAILLGSVFSGLVVYFLATGPFGRFLSGAPDAAAPSPLQVGLLGALAWNLYLLLSSYEKLDLTPVTYYWMTFRYVVAIIAGLVSTYFFREAGVALLFTLVATVIPYPHLVDVIRNRVPGMGASHPGEPPLWKIQGMQEPTVERLAALGIHTTQELAYTDPLMLLFRTNFQPKVVIDWIDQSLLYNYVGEGISKLRVRGIRGSIEMSGLKDGDPALAEVAEVLNITPGELMYLRNKLLNDYQLKLISTLWDEFKPQDPTAPRRWSPPQTLAEAGGGVAGAIGEPTHGGAAAALAGSSNVRAAAPVAESAQPGGNGRDASALADGVSPAGAPAAGEPGTQTKEPGRTK